MLITNHTDAKAQLTDFRQKNFGNVAVCSALIDKTNAQYSRHLHDVWHVQFRRGWRQQSWDVDAK